MNDACLTRGVENIRWSLQKLKKAGRLDGGSVEEVVSRLQVSTDLPKVVAEADLVIEAITEDLEAKQALLANVERLAPPRAVLASNTSNVSITALATRLDDRTRLCGMHFFNPPVLMRLVEIPRGLDTSQATYETVLDVCHRLGKETVSCKDAQGFITSRLITALFNEAMRIVEEGVATPEDVDRACRLGFNHAMGPLETVDWSGLDTALRVLEALRIAYGDHYRPTQTHRNLVRSGRVGRKAGRAIYSYAAK